MEPIGIASPFHGAASELVHDDNLAILHNIIDIALKEHVGLQRLICMMELVDIGRIVQIIHFKEFFTQFHALVGQHDLSRLFIDCVVCVPHEMAHYLVHLHVHVGGHFRWTGNNERRPGLVN